jgi:hypothetical protein
MNLPVGYIEIDDNGGARSGKDRRKLKAINHNPERRINRERRNGMDRRKGQINRGKLAIERRDKFRGSNFQKGA